MTLQPLIMKPYFILRNCGWKRAISEHHSRTLRTKTAMVLALGLSLLFCTRAAQAQCPVVLAIMVDACGTEQLNEFVIINSGQGFNTSNLQFSFDAGNNSFSGFFGTSNNDINIDLGNPVSDPSPCGLQPGNASLITGCSNVISVGLNYDIPPNSLVVLQTSTGANAAYDFSAVCGNGGCIYVIQNACTRTIGAFTNGPTGSPGPRTNVLAVSNLPGCFFSYTYNTTSLSGANGDYFIPPASFGNAGCVAPPIPTALPTCNPQFPGQCPTGSITLSNTCFGACVLCDFTTLTSSNNTASTGQQVPPDFCPDQQIFSHNVQWVGFVAGSSSITMTITPTNCVLTGAQGVQAGVWGTSDCNSFTLVSNCVYQAPPDVPTTLIMENLTVGGTYFFVVDGFNDDVCEFTVDVVSGATVVPPVEGIPEITAPPQLYCAGSLASFSSSTVTNAGIYSWTLDGVPVGTAPTVQLMLPDTNGIYQLCVTPSNVCNGPGQTVCREVIVGPSQAITAIICEGESFAIGDDTFSNAGVYNFTATSPSGCSQMITLGLTVNERKTTQLDSIICAGESIELGDRVLSETGSYTLALQTIFGCDSIVTLNLTVSYPIFTNAVPPILQCDSGDGVANFNLSQLSQIITEGDGNVFFFEDADRQVPILLPGQYMGASTVVYAHVLSPEGCWSAPVPIELQVTSGSFLPPISCVSTVCTDEVGLYTTPALGCASYQWEVSSHGQILSGGTVSDTFVVVRWLQGGEGLISLLLDGCPGASYCSLPNRQIVPIISDDIPIDGRATVCPGEYAVYRLPPFQGADIIWGVSTFGEILRGQGTSELLVRWRENASPGQERVWVQYESCFLGCGGSDTLNVTVLPRLYLNGPAEFCVGANAAYTLVQIGPNIITPSYWRLENSAGELIWATTDAIDTLYLDTIHIPDTYRLTAIPSDSMTFCRDSLVRRIRIAVPPPPLDLITGDSLVCPGSNSVFRGFSSETEVDIRWTITDGNTNRVRFGPEINVDWDVVPPYRIEATQAYRSGPRCFSPAIAFEPVPIDIFHVSGDPGLCSGTVGVYIASDTALGRYHWEIIPPDAGVLLENDSHQVRILWQNAGSAIVRLSICEQRAEFPVEVFQILDLGLLHPDTLCPGEIANVSAAPSFSEYLWLNYLGDTLSTDLTAVLDTGFFQLIATDAHGCRRDTTFSIIRRPSEKIPIFNLHDLRVCSGEPDTIVTLESYNGFHYQWYRNGLPVGTDTSVLAIIDTGSYFLSYTDQFGCQYISNILHLGCGSGGTTCVAPTIHIEVDSLPGCREFSFSVGFTTPPSSFHWSIRSPTDQPIDNYFTNLSQFNYTFNEAGLWYVTLSAKYPDPGEPDGICTRYAREQILIPVAASFEVEGQCAGDTLRFIDRTKYVPNTSIQSWSWNFGDPGSGASNMAFVPNPLHVFASSDTFPVSLTVVDTNGCSSTVMRDVVIHPKPTALFEIPDIQCPGAPLFLQADTMQIYGATIFDWNVTGPMPWMGSSASTHTQIDSSGTYQVALITKNIYQCSASLTLPLLVPERIAGNITALPDLAVCTGDSVLLTAPPGGAQWLWSNGTTTESLITETVGGFSVSATDLVGCTYSFEEVVVDIAHLPFFPIRAIVRDEFGRPLGYTYDSLSVCEGEDIFLEAVIESGFSIRWSNGSPLPQIEFSEDRNSLLDPGEHDIFLEIRDIVAGCSDTVFFHITVHPQPTPIAITATPPAPRCEGEVATFSVQSPQADVLYIWNTGDTATLVSTSAAGFYSVKAVNAFGCETKSDSLEIVSAPNIAGFPTGCYTHCRPDTLCLPANMEAISFEWLRNGQPFSQDSSPVVVESGAYQITAQNADGCTALSPPLYLDLYDGVSFVEGRVFLDINDNGIIDSSDSLLSDIRILISQPDGVLLQAISIDSGRYFVPFVPAGQYSLEVDSLSTGFPAAVTPGRVDTVFIGCNQVYSFDWLLIPACPSVFNSLSATICSGESYMWNGQSFDSDTTLTLTLSNAQGCDSIVTLHLEVTAPVSSSLTISICSGDTYSIGSSQYSVAGIYRDTLMASNGCDSIITLNLSLLSIDTTMFALQACDTVPVLYQGTEIPPGSTEIFVFTNQGGCDSVVVVSAIGIASPDYTLIVTPSCANAATGSVQISQIGLDDIAFFLPALQQTQTGSGNFVELAPGIYPFEVRPVGTGCIFRDTFAILAIPPLEIGGGNAEIDCSGDSLVLQAPVLSGQTLQTNWLWDNGITAESRTVTAPGSYSVAVTNGCESQIRTFVVTISSLLTSAQAEPDTIIGCPDTIAIAANLPAGTFGAWESPQPVSFGNPLQSTTFIYGLSGESAIAIWTLSTAACPEYSSDTVFIRALPLLLANNDALILRADSSSVSGRVLDNDVIPDDQDVLFEILDNPFMNNIVWENGHLIFRRTRLLPEEVRIPYQICLAACPTYCDTAFLTILVEEPDFLIPNAITPNEDGLNDVLFFDFLHNRPDRYPDNEIIIFNRWGDIVFRAKPYLNNWGGTNQSGKLLPQGTYYFILYLDIGQGVIIESDVTVVR
jgi:gliding motility-associated-like protein